MLNCSFHPYSCHISSSITVMCINPSVSVPIILDDVHLVIVVSMCSSILFLYPISYIWTSIQNAYYNLCTCNKDNIQLLLNFSIEK